MSRAASQEPPSTSQPGSPREAGPEEPGLALVKQAPFAGGPARWSSVGRAPARYNCRNTGEQACEALPAPRVIAGVAVVPGCFSRQHTGDRPDRANALTCELRMVNCLTYW